ncbi:MAG: class I SAM-dependent methyltransferase [Verrucomicrobiales bacterium]|nr:class I SAM-dependent methyltransferase [Methyloprofundus sp.]
MKNLKNKIELLKTYQSICIYLPEDHSNPQSLNYCVEQYFTETQEPLKVLDLGCGEGNSIDFFQRLSESVIWHGVDIENSPEVKHRTRENAHISTFNGIDLPYPDNYFDLIFCHQVLEHVRHPDALISDALRVMKPNGKFMGSVSYLEPYHSYSIFNFTPYGIARIFSDAGFELKEIRPGVDASMLINRQLLNRSILLRPIWQHNYLYGIINFIGWLFNLEHKHRNFLKIQFSGHLVFIALYSNQQAQQSK